MKSLKSPFPFSTGLVVEDLFVLTDSDSIKSMMWEGPARAMFCAILCRRVSQATSKRLLYYCLDRTYYVLGHSLESDERLPRSLLTLEVSIVLTTVGTVSGSSKWFEMTRTVGIGHVRRTWVCEDLLVTQALL